MGARDASDVLSDCAEFSDEFADGLERRIEGGHARLPLSLPPKPALTLGQRVRSSPHSFRNERPPPHNLEAEQALLGAILVNNEALDRVSGFLSPAHFFDPLHGRIFETLATLIHAGKTATPVTVKTFFENAEPIDANLTVPQYLGRLAANATTVINAAEYGRTIYDLATRRSLIIIGEDMVNTAYDSAVDHAPRAQIAESQALLDGLGEKCSSPRFFTGASLEGKLVPTRQWTISAAVPCRNVATIAGEGATGKSTICQMAASCVAVGAEWLGLTVARGPAIYLNAEDEEDELHIRQANIAEGMGLPLARFSDLHLWSLAGEDATLATFDERGRIQPTARFRELERKVARIRPEIVVLDPIVALFGGNELAKVHVRAFVGMLRGLAIGYSTAVVLAAHPSLTGIANNSGNSGSLDWGNAVRSRLFLKRVVKDGVEDDERARTLEINKINYGPKGAQIRVRWDAGMFKLDDGSFADAAVESAGVRAEEAFLRLLAQYNARGLNVYPVSGRGYAPNLFAADKLAEGIKKKAFENAMARLLDGGRIRIETYGPPSRQVRRLVIP